MVRACRHRLGLTQDELGWRSNLHRTYIADVERGARNVTLRSIINLAKALEVTVGHMLSHAADLDGQNNAHDASPGEPADVLLVEDVAADAALTERAFKRARVTNRLRVARDAEEALGMLHGAPGKGRRGTIRPGLILLDLKLPGMSGIELLRRIKADRRTKDIPLVVLTVAWSDKSIIECGRLGAANYIIKPFGIESLIRLAPKLDLHLTLGNSPN